MVFQELALDLVIALGHVEVDDIGYDKSVASINIIIYEKPYTYG
jgi:hypothetical protein